MIVSFFALNLSDLGLVLCGCEFSKFKTPILRLWLSSLSAALCAMGFSSPSGVLRNYT